MTSSPVTFYEIAETLHGPCTTHEAVDIQRAHVLEPPAAELTLVEYGRHGSRSCHAAHQIVAELRSRFNDRMRYVFRHPPDAGGGNAQRAAELAEYASATTGEFWLLHDALVKRAPVYTIPNRDDFSVKELLYPYREDRPN